MMSEIDEGFAILLFTDHIARPNLAMTDISFTLMMFHTTSLMFTVCMGSTHPRSHVGSVIPAPRLAFGQALPCLLR